MTVTNAIGQARTIGSGEQTKVSGTDAPKTAEMVKAELVSVAAAVQAPQPVAPPPIVPPAPTKGVINFDFNFPGP